MTDRLLLAYGLMLLMGLAIGAIIWWNLHHSHLRIYRRRQATELRKERATDAAAERRIEQ